jgi:CBS domain-containing protein
MTVDAGSTVDDVIDLMIAKNISAVPVTRDGCLSGVVTRNSLIRAL